WKRLAGAALERVFHEPAHQAELEIENLAQVRVGHNIAGHAHLRVGKTRTKPESHHGALAAASDGADGFLSQPKKGKAAGDFVGCLHRYRRPAVGSMQRSSRAG